MKVVVLVRKKSNDTKESCVAKNKDGPLITYFIVADAGYFWTCDSAHTSSGIAKKDLCC